MIEMNPSPPPRIHCLVNTRAKHRTANWLDLAPRIVIFRRPINERSIRRGAKLANRQISASRIALKDHFLTFIDASFLDPLESPETFRHSVRFS